MGAHPLAEVIEAMLGRAQASAGSTIGLEHERLFVLAEYPYGALLSKNGKFQFPANANQFDAGLAADALFGNARRNEFPLGIVMENAFAVSFKVASEGLNFATEPGVGMLPESSGIQPVTILQEGDVFGTFEICDADTHLESFKYDVSSGCRRVHLLYNPNHPALRDFDAFNRLAGEIPWKIEWNRAKDQPFNHCFGNEIIQKICNDSKWKAKVLLVSSCFWNDSKRFQQPALDSFRRIVSQIAWKQSQHMRAKFFTHAHTPNGNTVDFTKSLTRSSVRKKYHPDVLRLLEEISWLRQGHVLGLQPVLDSGNEAYGPLSNLLSKFQNAFDAEWLRLKRDSPNKDNHYKCLSLMHYQSIQQAKDMGRSIFLPFACREQIKYRTGAKGDMNRVQKGLEFVIDNLPALQGIRFHALFPRDGKNDPKNEIASKFLAKDLLKKEHCVRLKNGDLLPLEHPWFHGFFEIEPD